MSEPPAERRAGHARRPGPRAPTLLDALLPIVVLIALLALTIVLFGIDATNGPLQVALLLSAAFASLMAFKNGYTVAGVADAAVGRRHVRGRRHLHPARRRCADRHLEHGRDHPDDRRLRDPAGEPDLVLPHRRGGLRPRRAWSPAAPGPPPARSASPSSAMASVMGLDDAIAAGAVICGAYFGDKMTPLSETTILVPKLVGGGLTVGEHVRNMFWTAGPALGISLVIFLVLGLNADPEAEISTDAAREALAAAFNIGVRQPAAAAAAGGLLDPQVPAVPVHPGIRALRRHPGAVHPVGGGRGVRGRPEPRAGRHRRSRPSSRAMATGFVSNSGVEPIDDLFSRGGMASLLTHDLAGARRAVVRRRHGARGLPPAAARPDRGARPAARVADPRGQLQRDRPERDRRRPVRRRRPPRTHVPRASSPSAGWLPRCCPGPSRTRAR